MAGLRVLPIGPPGAGKGTQSRRIAEEYDIPHISTGDMLRENKDMETEHGTPGEYMDAGELVPDAVVKRVVEEALSDRDGFILDGYPRTIEQAEHLDSVTSLDAILSIVVDREAIIERLSGRRVDPETGRNYHVEFDMPDDPAIRERLIQREDDQPDQIETRLDEYESKTEPVLEYYRDEAAFVEVDGQQSPDAVYAEIAEVLDDIA